MVAVVDSVDWWRYLCGLYRNANTVAVFVAPVAFGSRCDNLCRLCMDLEGSYVSLGVEGTFSAQVIC